MSSAVEQQASVGHPVICTVAATEQDFQARWGPFCNTQLTRHSSCACRQLGFEDVWAFFGDGVHPHAKRIYEAQLAPFMSQTANNFWRNRLWYFSQGLYYQGGMVRTGP